MAITFFGVASTPADNGAQAGPLATITPPASMQEGDLVVVLGQYRGTDLSIRNFDATNVATEHGGQRWSTCPIPVSGTADVSLRIFHCRFNGTWSANPSWQISDSGVEALTLVMLVFRPTTSAKWWVPNVGAVRGTFAAGVSPFTKTITGITTATRHGSQSHVAIALWGSADANTWGNLSGANWSKTGLAAQYRNTTGLDQSMTLAYQIQTASGATGNVSQDQLTLGGDAGSTFILSLTEIDLPAAGTGGSAAHVQSAGAQEITAATFISKAFPAAVGNGNSVVVFVSTEAPIPEPGGNVDSITDNMGNEYIIIQRVDTEGLQDESLIAYRPNITNAPTTITATHNGLDSGLRAIAIHEITGGVVLDNYGGRRWQAQDGFSQETPSAYPTVTPSVAGCYCFGGTFAAIAEDRTYTAVSPWVKREDIGASAPIASFSFVQGAAAPVTFEFTMNLGADCTPLMAVLRPADVNNKLAWIRA